MERAVGKSHGKIILMGDHSVVYHQPSIAIPFKAVTIEVSLQPAGNHSYIFSDLYEGPVQEAPDSLDSLVGLFNLLRRDYHVEHYHLMITIKSTIPIERGMGSSAALSVAMTKAFFHYIQEPLTDELLLKYADFAETITHGNPSGLDARVTAYDQPLFFIKGETTEVIHFSLPYWLLICDTGVPGNTKEAVQSVRDFHESDYPIRRQSTDLAIRRMGDLTRRLHQYLIQKKEDYKIEEIGSFFHDYQENLKAIQVSSPELDMLTAFCEDHGAYGAKLTGGGRGGCFFALVPDQATGEQLNKLLRDKNLVAQTWLMPFTSD